MNECKTRLQCGTRAFSCGEMEAIDEEGNIKKVLCKECKAKLEERERILKLIDEKISYIRIQFEDEDILDEYCCELKRELKNAIGEKDV